jgi:hypothetical protein
MLTTERHFRVVQLFCIVVVLTCFQVALRMDATSPEITTIHWVLIGMGVWAIVSGFIVERQIVGHPNKVRSRSTRIDSSQSLESRKSHSRCECYFGCMLGPSPAREWWSSIYRLHVFRRRRIAALDLETQLTGTTKQPARWRIL